MSTALDDNMTENNSQCNSINTKENNMMNISEKSNSVELSDVKQESSIDETSQPSLLSSNEDCLSQEALLRNIDGNSKKMSLPQCHQRPQYEPNKTEESLEVSFSVNNESGADENTCNIPESQTQQDDLQDKYHDLKPIINEPQINIAVENDIGTGKTQNQTVPKSEKSELDSSSSVPTTYTGSDFMTPQLSLLSLPLDSIHSIASFLSPSDLTSFCCANTNARRVCRSVLKTVRMHGFRCAVEVIAAWAKGQQADALELAALYIKNGVPIYPPCQGHSLHTIIWRMSVEAREMETRNSPEYSENDRSNDTSSQRHNSTSSSRIPSPTNIISNLDERINLDRFYTERYDSRELAGYYIPSLTYLEEKCLFWKHINGDLPQLNDNNSNNNRTAVNNILHNPGANNIRPDGFLLGGLPPAPIGLQQFDNENHLNPDMNLGPFGNNQHRLGQGNALGGAMAMNAGGPWNNVHHNNIFRRNTLMEPLRDSSVSNRMGSRRNSASTKSSTRKQSRSRLVIQIHNHLANQHFLGRSSVDNEGSVVQAGPISFSTNFFHPNEIHGQRRCTYCEEQQQYPYNINNLARRQSHMNNTNNHHSLFNLDEGTNHGHFHQNSIQYFPGQLRNERNGIGGLMGEPINAEGDHIDFHEARNVDVSDEVSGSTPNNQQHSSNAAIDQRQSINNLQSDPMYYPNPHHSLYPVSPQSDANIEQQSLHNNHHPQAPSPITSDVTLQLYNSSLYLDDVIKARIDYYHRKLETFLNNSSDSVVYNSGSDFAFSECLADFWDVFFPLTTGILFFDNHTPVPRRSHLNKFLTKPCPKAIGIVQCEIERIRAPQRKRKGVKGRLFPTYEYRLFIHDKRTVETNSPHSSTESPPVKRKDTVLMVAKNKGRNHNNHVSKRGMNNYYLYMASEKDSDDHHGSFGFTEQQQSSSTGKFRHSKQEEDNIEFEMGRLQSNFIGTEFEIFSPSYKKPAKSPSLFTVSDSENETDLDQSVNARTRDENLPQHNQEIPQSSDNNNVSATSKKKSKRKSLKNYLSRHKSRRAIANVDADSSSSAKTSSQQCTGTSQASRCEDEDGAITYTANLLGNRPRIMDVCIPKVREEGQIGEWERYIRTVRRNSSGETNRMLNKFKILQEQLNNPDGGGAPGENSSTAETDIPQNFGLQVLQNRPPVWNVELGAFVLNFGGRVSVASVKNFQLCDRNDQDHIMLQFGRIQGRHSFTMDFQYPLTATQAFAIAISSLQSKISLG